MSFLLSFTGFPPLSKNLSRPESEIENSTDLGLCAVLEYWPTILSPFFQFFITVIRRLTISNQWRKRLFFFSIFTVNI